MTLCTVASRHACDVVMIEVILCAASLSLCYTATCYDNSGCIGSCWCMGDSRCTASPLHIQAEQTQIQWKQPLLVCCFHDVYNIMARRICVNRFWLAGGKTIILIGSPFYTCIVGVNPQPWMPINTLFTLSVYSCTNTWMQCFQNYFWICLLLSVIFITMIHGKQRIQICLFPSNQLQEANNPLPILGPMYGILSYPKSTQSAL